MNLVTNNKNEFTNALEALMKSYCEEYEGTITVDIIPIKIEKSKLNEWKTFCREAYRKGEDEYCTKWNRGFKQDNPLAKSLMCYIDNTDRHQSVDMIDSLEETICNDAHEKYEFDEACINDILEHPENYPEELVKDLDSVIAQFYRYHPLFKWHW